MTSVHFNTNHSSSSSSSYEFLLLVLQGVHYKEKYTEIAFARLSLTYPSGASIHSLQEYNSFPHMVVYLNVNFFTIHPCSKTINKRSFVITKICSHSSIHSFIPTFHIIGFRLYPVNNKRTHSMI